MTSAAVAPKASTRNGASQRPEPDAQRAQALQHAEDARQHVVRHHPGHQRERRHVDHGVADADHAGGEQRDGVHLPQPHHRQRQPPQADRDRQPPQHGPAADQQGRQRRAGDEGPDAHGALDHADAGLAAVEQVDRDAPPRAR